MTSLDTTNLPNFDDIQIDQIESCINDLISKAKDTINEQLKQDHFTWENLIQPIEEADDRLSRAFSPVSHLNSVKNSEELREVYEKVIAVLSQYGTEVSQNEALSKAYQAIKDTQFDQLNAHQQKVINDGIRDFKLSGVALDADKKARFAQIRQALSELTTQFENNVMDATGHFLYVTENKDELAGLQDHVIEAAAAKAKSKDKTGYALGIDFPTYFSVITYADNRDLRRMFYEAFSTRASDQGPDAGKFDNSDLIQKLWKLRQEMAQIVGFDSYADYSLATKMAASTHEVLGFLNDLATKTRPFAQKDLDTLKAFAKTDLEAWDMAYYSEKLQQQDYQLSQEELRPYFPMDKALSGLFALTKRLYDIDLKLVETSVWDDQVRYYDLVNSAGEKFGGIYIDLFAREHKRGGAWMDDCRVRRVRSDGSLQLPVAYLTCNFMPASGERPALLTHDDIITLFHEFGHCLHHLMTKIDYADISGINGVPWDAVELPSQFMENFAWSKEVLNELTEHYETGEQLPDELFERLTASKNFQSGLGMLRQLEFSLFDFELYSKTGDSVDVQGTLNDVRSRVSLLKPPAFNRFQCSFSHIFAGGYAAGYYSYKWAEVLSSDAFSRFEEEGLFNAEVGRAFLECILEKGGSEEPMELFKAFRGREPSIEPLLVHSGLVESE